MDELQRLYEHQTMMAIGIYSFLDNLLAHIPPRSETENDSVVQSTRSSEISSHLPIRSTINEFTTGLLGLTRMETFRERQERIRLSQASLGDDVPALVETRNESAEDASSRSIAANSNPTDLNETQPNKSEIIPGGYSENIFIYLSEREKEEFSCAVCYSILKEAYQCQNEHKFCYGCIYTWSTGPTAGHDSCPVCRSDGLYAKNVDIIDRINRKHVRCPETECNWVGLLSAYSSHEHRRYSSLELDFLIYDYKRDKLVPIIPELKTDEQVMEETSKIQVQTEIKSSDRAQSNEQLRDRTSGTNVGSSPEICAPLTDSLSQTETVRVRNTPQGLVNLGRRERSTQNRNTQVLRNELQRGERTRSSSISQNSTTPTRTRNIPSTLNNSRLQSRRSHNTVVNSQPNRPVIVNRTVRLGTSTRQNQVSRGAGLSRRLTNRQQQIETSSQIIANELQALRMRPNPNEEGSPSLSDVSAVESEQVSEDSSGSAYTTDSMSLLDRSEPNQSPSVSMGCIVNELRSTSPQTEQLSLPAIRPSNALTTSINQNPMEQGNEGQSIRRPNQSPIEGSTQRTNRHLEFRRLVPRRQGRVVEQLRETREQLAAMLRLMTTELEERRQHVLNVTLETASRGRLLHNLHLQRIQNVRRDDGLDTVNSNLNSEPEDRSVTDSAQQIRFRSIHPQESAYQTECSYNPRTAGVQHQHPYYNSNSNLLTPTFRESNTNEPTRTNLNDPGQEHTTVSSTTRLLARLRLNSLNQTNTSMLLSRNRGISSLLTDSSPQVSAITGWSSDEEQSDN